MCTSMSASVSVISGVCVCNQMCVYSDVCLSVFRVLCESVCSLFRCTQLFRVAWARVMQVGVCVGAEG